MEEFVTLSGQLVELHIASDITGLTQQELRKCKDYTQVKTGPTQEELDAWEAYIDSQSRFNGYEDYEDMIYNS